jgi:hypothetical protein
MRRPLGISTLFLGAASFCSVAAAQHAGAPAVAAPAMHAVPAPMHAAPVVSAHAAPASGTHSAPVHNAGHPSAAVRSAPHNGATSRPVVRSVGTSAPHAPRSAWYPGLPPNPIAPIPPFVPNTPIVLPGGTFFGHSCFSGFGCLGRNHFRTGGVIIPWGGFGGFYVPVPYYEPSAPEEQGDSTEANASDQNDTRNQQVEAYESVPQAAPNYYSPGESVSEYVFVKRDGTKIFAVAYSLTSDKIQYVTKEGLRRTVQLDALDFEATQKSNEERGNTVNLPSPPPAAMAMAI